MKRTLHALVAILLFAALDARAESTPAATDRIAVGPYQVQAASAGSGRYTVIFESGFGTDLRAWRKVAPELAKSARVLSYSRAGYGGLDARPAPRTLLQSSIELDQLIAATGAPAVHPGRPLVWRPAGTRVRGAPSGVGGRHGAGRSQR